MCIVVFGGPDICADDSDDPHALIALRSAVVLGGRDSQRQAPLRRPIIFVVSVVPSGASRQLSQTSVLYSSMIADELALPCPAPPRGTQPCQGDYDEPVERRLGGQAARCGEGMKEVGREFAWRDIIAKHARLRLVNPFDRSATPTRDG